MRSSVKSISRNKKFILLAAVLIIAGGVFGWEVRETKDALTGQTIARDRGVVFLWQASSLGGEEGRRVNFRVRRWFCYGLYKVDVSGEMAYGAGE